MKNYSNNHKKLNLSQSKSQKNCNCSCHLPEKEEINHCHSQANLKNIHTRYTF